MTYDAFHSTNPFSGVLRASFGSGAGEPSRQVIPPPGVATYGTPGPYVFDTTSARHIPAVGRAVQLYAGLVKQMPIDAYRGYQRLPQPRLSGQSLARPLVSPPSGANSGDARGV